MGFGNKTHTIPRKRWFLSPTVTKQLPEVNHRLENAHMSNSGQQQLLEDWV